jgi:hypothetical protein
MSVARKRKKVKRLIRRVAKPAKKRVSVNTRSKKKKKVSRVVKKRVARVARVVKPKRTRSEAAKAGWATRKKKERKRIRARKKALRLQKAKHPELKGIERVFKQETRDIEADMRAKILKEFADLFITPGVAERIKERMQQKLTPELLTETDESKMVARLILAEELGTFDDEAYALAEEYDWMPQEVYSLWWGYY